MIFNFQNQSLYHTTALLLWKNAFIRMQSKPRPLENFLKKLKNTFHTPLCLLSPAFYTLLSLHQCKSKLTEQNVQNNLRFKRGTGTIFICLNLCSTPKFRKWAMYDFYIFLVLSRTLNIIKSSWLFLWEKGTTILIVRDADSMVLMAWKHARKLYSIESQQCSGV